LRRCPSNSEYPSYSWNLRRCAITPYSYLAPHEDIPLTLPQLRPRTQALGMVHILLRPPHSLLAQASHGDRLPHLQFRPGHQIPPRRAAAATRRWRTTGTRCHDEWWGIWWSAGRWRLRAASAGRAAIQVDEGKCGEVYFFREERHDLAPARHRRRLGSLALICRGHECL
jgi:hypothetical protein